MKLSMLELLSICFKGVVPIGYVKHDNVLIHCHFIESEDPEASETLILLHGLGPDMNSWNFILPYFRKHYHVLLYDLRGFGKSQTNAENVTLTKQADDLAFLLSEFNIGDYHVIAQGFSGFIGVKHATDYQNENLQTLTLMTAPVYFPTQLGKKIIQERKAFVDNAGSLYPLAKRLIDQICYPLTEEKASILLDGYKQVAPDVYFQLFRNHFAGNAAAQLNRINVPTLLLSGAEDYLYLPELFGATLQFYRNARHYVVPDAAFMMQLDQPELTADWIHNFIQKSNGQTSPERDQYRKTLASELYTEMHDLISQHTTAHLHVNVMDGFSVYLNDERIYGLWGKRKAKQLLVYLALHQSATREELCDLFWPDSGLQSAKNSLRVALHHLKKALEAGSNYGILITEKDMVFIRGEVSSDVGELMEQIENAHLNENEAVKTALYSQLLRNIPVNPLPGLYEEWFLELRGDLEKEFGMMALFLADYYVNQNNYTEARHYLKIASRYSHDEEHLEERSNKLRKRIK
ncbi:Pimeloyl-ACP methyl ester carboxylesterase [Lentibacillus persicus]|uniref:Pimeloyl-ACP methyl ester carboxylesterase n=2 Tax=Lentibacillus persicus TaxID=640948 RepID=A0A1I1S0K4_9BACI|nr:Pimeloyl-ACP methyl ester carboxylesterase [Lentibacillus persicus]